MRGGAALRHNRDTVLLSGWLFADLLLGLMVIFMASLPGTVPLIPPQLKVSPNELSQTSPACSGGITALHCILTVSETQDSTRGMTWTLKGDFSSTVKYSATSGTLTPGHSSTITITAITCQSGSFIFQGSNGAAPVIVPWNCTPKPQRLETTFCRLILTDGDPNRFLSDLTFAKRQLEPQIYARPYLKGREVGIAIATGGTLDVGTALAAQAYLVLLDMAKQGPLFAKASQYESLYTSLQPSTIVVIDIYLVVRQDNQNNTCGGTDHQPL